MSMLTLEEAISHALEVAEQEECFINYPHSDIVLGDLDIESRKHYVAEQKQLAEWLTELKEAKRLLKAVAKIVKNLPCDDDNCGECVHNDNGYVCSEYECFEWRYADEALALIGEEGENDA